MFSFVLRQLGLELLFAALLVAVAVDDAELLAEPLLFATSGVLLATLLPEGLDFDCFVLAADLTDAGLECVFL